MNRRSAASPGRRLYTVLPPPADYHVQSEDPASLSQLNGVNSEEEPAGTSTIIVHLWPQALCTIKLGEMYA